eukprot:2460889-Ditylum_brightwellii.AAC.2
MAQKMANVIPSDSNLQAKQKKKHQKEARKEVIENTSLDLCNDETTWSNILWRADVVTHLQKGSSILKGGQIVMTFDTYLGKRYLCAYVYKHSLHHKDNPFTIQGEMETKKMINKLKPRHH